jgi:hypothetical protein
MGVRISDAVCFRNFNMATGIVTAQNEKNTEFGENRRLQGRYLAYFMRSSAPRQKRKLRHGCCCLFLSLSWLIN